MLAARARTAAGLLLLVGACSVGASRAPNDVEKWQLQLEVRALKEEILAFKPAALLGSHWALGGPRSKGDMAAARAAQPILTKFVSLGAEMMTGKYQEAAAELLLASTSMRGSHGGKVDCAEVRKSFEEKVPNFFAFLFDSGDCGYQSVKDLVNAALGNPTSAKGAELKTRVEKVCSVEGAASATSCGEKSAMAVMSKLFRKWSGVKGIDACKVPSSACSSCTAAHATAANTCITNLIALGKDEWLKDPSSPCKYKDDYLKCITKDSAGCCTADIASAFQDWSNEIGTALEACDEWTTCTRCANTSSTGSPDISTLLAMGGYADLICAKDGTDYCLTTGGIMSHINLGGLNFDRTKKDLDSMCSPCSLKMVRILARLFVMIDSQTSNEIMALLTLMKAMCARDADDSYCALTPAGQQIIRGFGSSSDSSDPDAPPDWNSVCTVCGKKMMATIINAHPDRSERNKASAQFAASCFKKPGDSHCGHYLGKCMCMSGVLLIPSVLGARTAAMQCGEQRCCMHHS